MQMAYYMLSFKCSMYSSPILLLSWKKIRCSRTAAALVCSPARMNTTCAARESWKHQVPPVEPVEPRLERHHASDWERLRLKGLAVLCTAGDWLHRNLPVLAPPRILRPDSSTLYPCSLCQTLGSVDALIDRLRATVLVLHTLVASITDLAAYPWSLCQALGSVDAHVRRLRTAF
jgi:hypothetical protein